MDTVSVPFHSTPPDPGCSIPKLQLAPPVVSTHASNVPYNTGDAFPNPSEYVA